MKHFLIFDTIIIILLKKNKKLKGPVAHRAVGGGGRDEVTDDPLYLGLTYGPAVAKGCTGRKYLPTCNI